MYFMRTTIDIEDSIFRQAKATASLQGISLKRFFEQSLKQTLELGESTAPVRHRIRLPLVPSTAPSSLNLDAHRVATLLDEEDLSVSP